MVKIDCSIVGRPIFLVSMMSPLPSGGIEDVVSDIMAACADDDSVCGKYFLY